MNASDAAVNAQVTAVIVVVLTIAGYFLPTIIAMGRGHRNKLGVFLLDFFLGWTLIGWVGALIWSVLNEKKVRVA